MMIHGKLQSMMYREMPCTHHLVFPNGDIAKWEVDFRARHWVHFISFTSSPVSACARACHGYLCATATTLKNIAFKNCRSVLLPPCCNLSAVAHPSRMHSDSLLSNLPASSLTGHSLPAAGWPSRAFEAAAASSRFALLCSRLFPWPVYSGLSLTSQAASSERWPSVAAPWSLPRSAFHCTAPDACSLLYSSEMNKLALPTVIPSKLTAGPGTW